jgi:hypothetical protein
LAVPIITLCLDTETAEIERENRQEKERKKKEGIYTTRPETVGLLGGSGDVIKTVGRAISMAEREWMAG